MRSILERYKKLVFKAKIRRYIKIFQEFSTQKTGFLSVPKQVRIAPVRLVNLIVSQEACANFSTLDNLFLDYIITSRVLFQYINVDFFKIWLYNYFRR